MNQTTTDPVVMPESDLEDDYVHLLCCYWRDDEQEGRRLYAFCGKDLTDEEEMTSDEVDRHQKCPVCKPHEEEQWRQYWSNDRCAGCPQVLFGGAAP